MKFFSVFPVVLAIFQAFAKSEPNSSFHSNSFNNINRINGAGAYESSLPVVNTRIQTSTVENPTVNFPSYIPPTSISESCHCMRTLVRPQIRNEIITVPTVDRIIRTVSTPIVETINCGSGSRLGTLTQNNNLLPGVSRTQSLSDGIQCNPERSSSGYFNEADSLRGFSTTQNINGVASATNGVSIGMIAKPSIIRFQTSNGGNPQGFLNIFSPSTGYSNDGRINGF